MEILIKILQFVAALSLLVLVHELGHFLFAKLFKCRVDKFYLFFNPWFTPLKFRVGQTEYGIGWLPLGGYCKIAGMVDESMDTAVLKEAPKPWEFRSKPAWQRLLIMVGGVLMNIVLAFVVYTGMSMRWGDTYLAVEDINDSYGFAFSETMQNFGFENGDKIVSVNGELPETDYDLVMSLVLDEAKYVEVERGGQIVRVPMHPQYTAELLNDPMPMAANVPLVVDEVLPGTGAEAAGLQAGDRIVAVDGKRASYVGSPASENAGQTVPVEIERGRQTLTLPVSVSDDGTLGFNRLSESAFIPFRTRTYTLTEAIPRGFQRTGAEIGSYFKQLRLIFTPGTGAHKQVGGLITIGKIFPSSWDWGRFWSITAMLSVMLAIVNLIPIPGLDGGHVLFVLYEMVARRKPGDRFMEAATWVGLILVLLLMVYANGNDVVRLLNK